MTIERKYNEKNDGSTTTGYKPELRSWYVTCLVELLRITIMMTMVMKMTGRRRTKETRKRRKWRNNSLKKERRLTCGFPSSNREICTQWQSSKYACLCVLSRKRNRHERVGGGRRRMYVLNDAMSSYLNCRPLHFFYAVHIYSVISCTIIPLIHHFIVVVFSSLNTFLHF